MSDFLWFQISILASLLTIQYCTGLLVRHKGVKVNYTRKINHFALFFVPLFLRSVFPHEPSFGRFITGCVIGTLILFIYIKPLRNKIPGIATMFLSFDRPEDRPHTLRWLVIQYIASYIVLIPILIYLDSIGKPSLLLIPFLVNGIGDGLAEPVGVRFGRHKYSVYALFSKKKYVRSLEGSACVFVTSIVTVLLLYTSFTPNQFLAAIVSIPISMTLTEAIAPHTIDSPFLYAASGLATFGILQI